MKWGSFFYLDELMLKFGNDWCEFVKEVLNMVDKEKKFLFDG